MISDNPMSIRAALVGISLLVISSGPTAACEFEDVAKGQCPVTEVEERVAREYDRDRATAVRDLAWINHPEFKSLARTDVIALNVCVFRRSAQSVFPNIIEFSRDFGDNVDRLSRIVSQIERAVEPWEIAQSDGFVKSRSRVDFVFRDEDGGVRECEASRNNHILVMLGSRNSSAVGFDALSEATRRGGKSLATMILALGDFDRVTPDKVLHEFGHALGFLHEMHHDKWRDCADAFDSRAYAKRVNFGPNVTQQQAVELVERNIATLPSRFRRAARPQTFNFERTGIMSYLIEEELFDPAKVDPSQCAMPIDAVELQSTDIALFLGIYGT